MIIIVILSYEFINTNIQNTNLSSSVHHFVDPITGVGTGVGAFSFLENTMADHIYFSDNLSTILWGNSMAGHIGVLSVVGETNSDMGVINSINANGIFVTFLIYFFYLSMIWVTRKKDWRSVALLVLLSLALSFKETGLFTSHATPVLFFIFFYNYLPTNHSHGNVHCHHGKIVGSLGSSC